MPTCSFCHQIDHTIQNCNNSMIEKYDNCIKYNAAYDFYLGLQTTYLQLYLSSLQLSTLRAVGYHNNILVKKNPNRYYCGVYVTSTNFIRQFIVYYYNIPTNKHIQLINTLSCGKIIIYSHNIHNLFMRNNILTNWSPRSISTILLSTRIFSIQLQIMSKQDMCEQYGDCCICYDNINLNTYCKLSCNHSFCSSCILKYIRRLYLSRVNCLTCPLCRDEITEITLSESNYIPYTDAISDIKKKRRPIYNNSDQEQLEYNGNFNLHIEYIPTLTLFHPQFKKVRYAIYVLIRIYVIIMYYELLFNVLYYLFKNASSYRNQGMLQI